MDGRERFSAVKNICAAQMGSKGFDRTLTSQFCSTAICAFSITCSPHWHSHVRPVTEHAQTVEVRTGLACVLHPTAGRDHAASARSSHGTQGSFWGAPTHKGQGTGCSHLHNSWRGRCAPPRSRSSFASAQLGAASPTATGRTLLSQRRAAVARPSSIEAGAQDLSRGSNGTLGILQFQQAAE